MQYSYAKGYGSNHRMICRGLTEGHTCAAADCENLSDRCVVPKRRLRAFGRRRPVVPLTHDGHAASQRRVDGETLELVMPDDLRHEVLAQFGYLGERRWLNSYNDLEQIDTTEQP